MITTNEQLQQADNYNPGCSVGLTLLVVKSRKSDKSTIYFYMVCWLFWSITIAWRHTNSITTTTTTTTTTNTIIIIMPRPGDIKRWCCLTSVCLTSVAYIRSAGGVRGRPAGWRVLADRARPGWRLPLRASVAGLGGGISWRPPAYKSLLLLSLLLLLLLLLLLKSNFILGSWFFMFFFGIFVRNLEKWQHIPPCMPETLLVGWNRK